MEHLRECIYRLPICGGFCAPTSRSDRCAPGGPPQNGPRRSPEKSCLRHFSNEYTLPASQHFMKLSPCIETNICCRTLGSMGVSCGHRHRRPLMLCSCGVSFIAMLLNLVALLAISSNPAVVKATAWSVGIMAYEGNLSFQVNGTTVQPATARVDAWVGLTGRVEELDCSASNDPARCAQRFQGGGLLLGEMEELEPGRFQRFVTFDDPDACWQNFAIPDVGTLGNAVEGLSGGAIPSSAEMCESCHESASSTFSLIIMAIVTQVPQMATNLQRATAFGDVNCQATFGVVTSVMGAFSTLSSLMTFRYVCWQSFPSISSDDNSVFDFRWGAGPGFACMVLATLLKFWDAFAHFLVPAPRARSKPAEQTGDLYDYLIRSELYESAVAPTP
ncbi:unnamed protein product [Effrenium voratum]|nr:unnamed protein product [Effrenium voratum]